MTFIAAPLAAARRLAPSSIFVAITVSVMAVHTLAREHFWRYEWLWATYQYHFGVLLLGPVLGGLGAWVGGRSLQARWLTHPAGRPWPAVLPLVVATIVSWAAYVVSWTIPATIVARSGTTDRPGLVALATFGPPLAAIAAYVAIGYAAGVSRPGRLVAPLTALLAFGATMLGWITGTERLVRLGGAGAAMSSLRPALAIQVAQTSWYSMLALMAAAWSARRLSGAFDHRWGIRAGAVGTALLTCWLILTPSPLFDHPAPSEVCVRRGGETICAAQPYRVALRPLADVLAPPLARMRAAGAPVGPRLLLGVTVGIFEPRPSPDLLASELFTALGVGNCWAGSVSDDIINLSLWVSRLVGAPISAPGAAVPSQLRSDDPVAQDAWAAAALRRVMVACPPGR